jgi:thymidylate synthase (FAD)
MTEITLSSDIIVKLIRSSASDSGVVQAAQVSVKGENNPGTDMPRLINYLMESRHGSPFEHNSFTFYVKAPIFVFREWQRHRMASYNEMSGRYTEMLPEFYTPNEDRKLINAGTPARPEMVPGTTEQLQLVRDGDFRVAQAAWDEYQARLDAGIAKEVARSVLPLNTYSQMYTTVNARAMMNFISLRTDSEDAAIRSRPQREIEMGAEQVEAAFAAEMPQTHASFVKHGRIAP